MDFTMKDIDQEIIKFNYDGNFKEDDFYVSKSNKQIFDLLNNWPKWEKNFLNISGEKFSGKTHLINIFLKKYKGTKICLLYTSPSPRDVRSSRMPSSA